MQAVIEPEGSTPGWHPPRAVLEILELALTGAGPSLPEVYALLGVADLAGLAGLVGLAGLAGPADGSRPAGRADAAHLAPPLMVRPLLVEDAEGTPVVRIEDGDRLAAVRPFTAPPLRAHRRAPGEGPGVGDGVLTVAVPGLPGEDDVAVVIGEAAAQRRSLRWLVLVGAGRGPLPPEGAWRAVRGLAELAERSGVATDVVPVAAPLLDGDRLAAEIARRYAGPGGSWRVLPVVASGRGSTDVPGLPRPVARELDRAVRPPSRRGLTVFFTGLSGSGKSTLAKALTARLVEDGRRTVTLLDGDEVRRLLSHGLGFSRADRDLNILRIGFVATEVTRHGGVAVCAPIAPFAAVRAQVRAAVEEVGDLVLVHVATSLAECERRDRKGLYVRARRGEIPDFTGISSPYEVPTDADLVVDTANRSVAACLEDVWGLLERRGYLG